MPAKDNRSRMLTAFGETRSVREWSARYRVPYATICSRVDRLGWAPEDAVRKRPSERFRGGGRHSTTAPRPVPRLKEHPDGRAFCRWEDGGRKSARYFGPFGSEEAGQRYQRFSSQWVAGQVRPAAPAGGDVVSITEFVADYLTHSKGYYTKAGRVTSEYNCVRAALQSVIDTRDEEFPCGEFKPPHLRECMDWMLAKEHARQTINDHAGRIIRAFKWGATEGYFTQDVPALLALLPRLKRAQTSAAERTKAEPIPWADVAAIFPHLFPGEAGRRAVLTAMVRLHWLTGMRPQSICGMRPRDIDRRPGEWRYTVPDAVNKTAHMDRDLVVYFGPQAQAILGPLLADCPPDRTVFGFPAMKVRGGREWIEIRREAYNRWVSAACLRAGVEPWTPRRMRHTRADAVRQEMESLSDAATAIGDTEEVTRQVYSSPSEQAARRIARELG